MGQMHIQQQHIGLLVGFVRTIDIVSVSIRVKEHPGLQGRSGRGLFGPGRRVLVARWQRSSTPTPLPEEGHSTTRATESEMANHGSVASVHEKSAGASAARRMLFSPFFYVAAIGGKSPRVDFS
jgi:hypothetical protein